MPIDNLLRFLLNERMKTVYLWYINSLSKWYGAHENFISTFNVVRNLVV